MDLITEILKRASHGVHRSTLLTDLDRHASQHDIKVAIEFWGRLPDGTPMGRTDLGTIRAAIDSAAQEGK